MMTAGLASGLENHNPEVMGNIGFTWKLGKDEDREDLRLPARYDRRQMASIYMMQSEMDRVIYENQKEKATIKAQESRIKKQENKINEQDDKIGRQEEKINDLTAKFERLEKLLLKK